MSIRKGTWSDYSAQNAIRYIGNEIYFITGSSVGVVCVCGSGVQSIIKTGALVSIKRRSFSPSHAQPPVQIYMFGVEVAAVKASNTPPKEAIRYAPISGWQSES